MATNPNRLPFHVVPFRNASGTISFRVTGSWGNERIRENYPDRASADAVCNAKNAEVLKAMQARPVRLVQTSVPDDALTAAEVGLDRISGRWPLSRVIEAGIAALEATPNPQQVGPLAEEWLTLMELELQGRWYGDLRVRVRRFVKDNPGLTTDRWDSVFTRTWLDSTGLGKQTRANFRNALHRFGGWLVERGFKRENPAGGITIRGRRTAAQRADDPLPAVFTPRQAEAFMWACQQPVCRKILGWASLCLFAGLRPNSEAVRATWAEVNFATRELSMLGRKRGAKARIVPLHDAAIAFLRLAKQDRFANDDGIAKPGFYLPKVYRLAVTLANERLSQHHPKENAIVWDEDITRHTYASYRSAQIPVHKLADEMGTSVAMIYGHYRHPRVAAEVKMFWALRPKS